jgi:DNA adenine methylase
MRIITGFNKTVAFHWAGGKKWMAPFIAQYLPKSIKRLLIPFFGRGDCLRLVRNLGVEAPALVSDIHPKVMVTHAGIKENPGEVVRLLEEHQRLHSPEYFIQVRDSFDLKNPKPQSAAAFCYGMNGSYKVCFKEKQNGEHTNISARRSVSCQPAAIYAHAIALRNTTFFTEDFAVMFARARKGDFVLIDSPYINTMGYGGISFGKADHIRLEKGCRELGHRGANFLLTSSDDPWIRGLFGTFSIEAVMAPRGHGAVRQKPEIIVTNY